MVREIVIGANIEPIFNSIALWKWGDASQNPVFYILKERLSDTRIYIYKESDEGKKIKEWLSCEENRNNESVQHKAFELLLPYLSVDHVLEIINNEKEVSYSQGYEQAQYDIRKALGIMR